jgi:AraC-like DNA-binding protein
VILALAATLAPFPAAGQGAAADGGVVDTSKEAAVDTLKPSAADTLKTSAVDASKPPAVDTSKAVAADTSKLPAADTVKSTHAPADTSKQYAADAAKSTRTAAAAPETVAADTPKTTAAYASNGDGADTSAAADSAFAFAYTFHILFFAVSIAVIALTVRFFLTRRDSRRFLTTTRLSVLDKSVQRGCRYIESNYGDPWLTPAKVCKALVTGQAYLDALFVNELGINVQDFIVQVRVNAIKNALASPQPPDLPGLCVRCGFKDRAEAEAHFARICGGVGIAEYGRSLALNKKG